MGNNQQKQKPEQKEKLQNSTKQKINIGIIGFGQRMQHLYKLLKVNLPDINLFTIYDPGQNSQQIAQQINKEVIICKTFQQLCEDQNIRWIFIGSLNNQHKDQVVEAFKNKKHVFCEKPLATTFLDCIEMKKAWESTDNQCMFILGFTLRFSAFYQKIREIVQEKKHLGEIISMEFNETLVIDHGGYIMSDWRRKQEISGGHILEKCCHDFDLVNWILDSRPQKVCSFGGLNFFVPKNEKRIKELGNDSYLNWIDMSQDPQNPFSEDKDIVDNQVAILEYQNKVRATFHTNCNTSQGLFERRMYICGSEGTLRADSIEGTIQYQKIGYDQEIVQFQSNEHSHNESDQNLIQSVCNAIKNNQNVECGINEGINSAFSCLALDIARIQSKVIDMQQFWDLVV